MLFFLIYSTYIIDVMVNTCCAHTGVRTSVAVQAVISCLLIIHTVPIHGTVSIIKHSCSLGNQFMPNVTNICQLQRREIRERAMKCRTVVIKLGFARPATEITNWQ